VTRAELLSKYVELHDAQVHAAEAEQHVEREVIAKTPESWASFIVPRLVGDPAVVRVTTDFGYKHLTVEDTVKP
jgi:hypothetical protein